MPHDPDSAALVVSGWKRFGPGFVVAATGVGAGDLIAATVVGQKYGLAVLWVVALGALFKGVLNEGVSRWQLATGTTLIEGWTQRLPRWVGYYFVAIWCSGPFSSPPHLLRRAVWPPRHCGQRRRYPRWDGVRCTRRWVMPWCVGGAIEDSNE